MNGIICEAIEKKRLLQFSYDDDLTRIVEPHLFGRKTSGNDALSAYLVGGYTETDSAPYWRTFLVEKWNLSLCSTKLSTARAKALTRTMNLWSRFIVD